MIHFPARRSKCENSLKICSLRQKHHLCTARHLCTSPFSMCAVLLYLECFRLDAFPIWDIASCTFTFLALLQHPSFLQCIMAEPPNIISHTSELLPRLIFWCTPKRDPSRDTLHLLSMIYFFLSFGKPACDLEFGGIRLSALINSFLCLPCFCMCGSASLIWILLQRIYIYTVSCAASVPDGKTNYLSSLIGIHRVHSFDRLSFIHPFRPVTPARSLGWYRKDIPETFEERIFFFLHSSSSSLGWLTAWENKKWNQKEPGFID